MDYLQCTPSKEIGLKTTSADGLYASPERFEIVGGEPLTPASHCSATSRSDLRLLVT